FIKKSAYFTRYFTRYKGVTRSLHHAGGHLDATSKRPPHLNPEAMKKFAAKETSGLLSPALSSKGGEGEDSQGQLFHTFPRPLVLRPVCAGGRSAPRPELR